VWGIWYSKPIATTEEEKKRPGIANAMLIDAWDERLGMPDLIKRVKEDLQARYGGDEQRPTIKPAFGPRNLTGSGRTVDTIVIEDKGSGISLRQMLARENIHAFAYNPGKADKLARLHAVSHLAHAGILYVMESKENPGRPISWAEPMLNQVCTFSGKGTIAHDDYVDSFSQAIRYLADGFRISATVKPKPEEYDPKENKPVQNPYAN